MTYTNNTFVKLPIIIFDRYEGVKLLILGKSAQKSVIICIF